MKRAPYPGQLSLGSTGEPVVLLKRALRLAGLLPGKGKPTGFLGPFARIALVRLARARQLPALDSPGRVRGGERTVQPFAPSGVYGPHAHIKLANYYDDYGAARLRAIARARQVASIRAAGLAACRLVIANRGVIHYTQSAMRMSGVRSRFVPPAFGHWEDCSSEATWIAFVMDQAARRIGGRYQDPNDRGYDGEGFTGTMTPHGVPVSAGGGALGFTAIFYGWPISHVVWKMTMTTAMSMGSEAGPLEESIYYRTPVTARYYPPTLPA